MSDKVVQTIRISPEERQQLRVRAAQAGVSMEEYVRAILFGAAGVSTLSDFIEGAGKPRAQRPTRAEIAEVFQVEEKWLRDPAPGTLIAKRIRDEKGKRL